MSVNNFYLLWISKLFYPAFYFSSLIDCSDYCVLLSLTFCPHWHSCAICVMDV